MIVQALRQLVALSKLRIVALLVFTAACGMWKAAEGVPDGATLTTVLLAGGLAAAGSNAINQALDSDIDAAMLRTRGRPVASHQVSRGTALLVGTVAVVVAVAALGLAVNWLSAMLTLAAAMVYVFVYTILLKRRSWNNIVIGGAAGAFPPFIGAAAVTGTVDAPGVYMFALVFFWTPPHFWTLALMLKDDYGAARVPMLPNVASHHAAAVQIVLYVGLLVTMAWLPFSAGYGGLTYALAASALGLEWMRRSLPLLTETVPRRDIASAYRYSLVYLALVFLVLAVEPALPWY